MKHDEVRDRFTPRFQDVGQNLGWRGRSYSDGGPKWTYATFGWYIEHKFFPPSYMSRLRVPLGVKTGHFSPLVWARTRYVGCGYVYHTVDKARYPHMHYACDYGPSGNYLRSAVYRESSTCSACPAPTQCNKLSGMCDGTSCNPDVTKLYVAPQTAITTWRPATPTPPSSATIPSSQATSDATSPPITFLCTEPPTPHLHTELPPRQEPMTEPPYAPDANPEPYPIPDPEDARPTPRANLGIFLAEASQLSAAIDDAFRELDSVLVAYLDIDVEEGSVLPFIGGCTAAMVAATLAAYFIF
ncbi:hypothetical protein HPB50_005314 [Hyalomma asiaticum]|uniref:Uncharacterized protein n=1 Tax=Hyalomma asiaticum TaxID=266040 RepID=A0ACB7SB98_HYAAI|nr:hypothetical protein HPB50_005314 [Hyalomma asiaticum]